MEVIDYEEWKRKGKGARRKHFLTFKRERRKELKHLMVGTFKGLLKAF